MFMITSALLLLMTKSAESKVPLIQRIAIVGAGAGGLIAADVFQSDGFDVVVYEKETFIGGVWKYKEPTIGSLSSPMYKSLRSNLPKQIMAYGDGAPFPQSVPSFLTHKNVQNYLEKFAEDKSLIPLIKFGRSVESISHKLPICSVDDSTNDSEERSSVNVSAEDTLSEIFPVGAWKIVTRSTTPSGALNTGAETFESGIYEEYFDAVVVCNGHYNTPLIPAMPNTSGIDQFQGEIMHSVDYDDPARFAGQSVLVVGSRSSGTDLAREISSVARVVYASDRSLPVEKGAIHGNIHHKQGILSFNSKEIDDFAVESGTSKGLVQFADKSIARVDILLWCTGYEYDYPFLKQSKESSANAAEFNQPSSPPLSVDIVRKRKVGNLYQQVFSISHPTLAFIGLPYSVVPFPLFHLQARWIASVFSGRSHLPSRIEQTEWLESYEKELLSKYSGNEDAAIEKFHYLGDAQWAYSRYMACAAGIDDERQLKYINVTEAIYNDNASIRPPYPGAPDTYRNSEYSLDYNTFEWTRK